ncbi:Glycosyltransferase involved in cell wall bisynthesis [Raineyella antarctica]|uniref:Glycosyltransferase involved in cell wall bisynthesis n=1 Tax=Raineyella antarctica TaxID=1577474 RepID=A0A1G6GD70_9ACTN|nr:glycosyltransferase [Raineyella antarctica]SDB79859.1 Glycosyltransferase involved in cell wall bisynthesis [Raineyella antarctica]
MIAGSCHAGPTDLTAPRIAIAHDYLTQRGGAERVVLSLVRAFPNATLHTTIYNPDTTYPEFRDVRIITSPLNRVAAFRADPRLALPLLPFASNGMHIDADVVIASSSGWAHGFPTTGRKLVYCHNPARWLYQPEDYHGDSGRFSPKRLAMRALGDPLRRWDLRAALRADKYLGNSRVVVERITRTYGIRADLVPPPHSIDATGDQEPVPGLADWQDRYHLVVSRLMPYKNVDRALEAFADLPDERLVVVGAGPLADQLRAAAPPNVRMVSGLTDAQLRWTYAHATALVAPSHEDFGLTPLEAASFGKPTLALHAGGYLDTINPAVNGVFFEAPAAGAIRKAVVRAGLHTWDPAAIRAHADLFSEQRFIARLQREVDAVLAGPHRPIPLAPSSTEIPAEPLEWSTTGN